MEGQIKRIAILCGYSFPEGLAPTIRILTYSKGLVECGIRTDIFIYFPTDNLDNSFKVNGDLFGVSYHYPGTRVYPSYSILRKLSHPYYAFMAMKNIYREHGKQKFDFIIISNDWFRILYLFIPFINWIKSKPIFIADEYPVPIRVNLRSTIPKWRKLLFKYILTYVKGMVFMTENLSVFYNSIVKKPSFILPTITDVSNFSKLKKDAANSINYMCYMGNMELSKDNVDNIIEAFNLISKRYSHFQLHLYGAPSANDYGKIIKLIENLDLQNNVMFKGKVSNDLVPNILRNSFLLVSSQPVSKRAEGGFPTKLGEYMASGVPTLLTNVGEISNYVSDGIHIWLAKANDPVHYAEKMEYIINNYDEALLVAQNAKEYVFNTFNYKSQSEKFKLFLEGL